ncbi:ly6/PLAUR domain-containing protein 1-like isoform X2 [Paramacrobiotus metropolitanus]|uniref:ly6/PLAUR domain-containing protein 1-like isoform X2 n=1 Tax=Paramacrobiotus metropolitanus TaxID=2943436 RepID=UPI002445798D|nr:ly6/PLAUR domain-containing protein 1-like isoform X2 [Paramacrobiotus metropolitanus]
MYVTGWMIPASYGIQCFVCDVVHLNSECNGTENIMQCPITYDTCMTMIRYSSDVGKMQISKLCSKREACWTQRRVLSEYAACDANETDEWACVSCCDSHDLCNTNRAGSELGRLPVPASAATAALLVFLWL